MVFLDLAADARFPHRPHSRNNFHISLVGKGIVQIYESAEENAGDKDEDSDLRAPVRRACDRRKMDRRADGQSSGRANSRDSINFFSDLQ